MEENLFTKYKWSIVTSALIVFLALIIFLNTYTPFFVIQSDSMLPLIKKGDIVLIRKSEYEDINVLNDKVIAFYNPFENKIYVHRVVGVKEGALLTKGDNSQFVDFYRPKKEDVLGEIFYVLKR